MPELRAATWNTDWRETASIAAATIRERLTAFAPDILCLTECQAGFLSEWGGHVAEGGSDWGYSLREGRREVLLWSRARWCDIDNVGSPALPLGKS